MLVAQQAAASRRERVALTWPAGCDSAHLLARTAGQLVPPVPPESRAASLVQLASNNSCRPERTALLRNSRLRTWPQRAPLWRRQRELCSHGSNCSRPTSLVSSQKGYRPLRGAPLTPPSCGGSHSQLFTGQANGS